jgi:ribosome-associated protein
MPRKKSSESVADDRNALESGDLPADVAAAVEAARDRKGRDLVVLDLRGLSTATDYFFIGTGTSDIHVRGMADHIIDELKRTGVRPNHVEGLQGGRWILIDYIDFVIHLFHPAAREFYQLEHLWGDAARLDVES